MVAVAVVGLFLPAARSVFFRRPLALRQRAVYHEEIGRLETDSPTAAGEALRIEDLHNTDIPGLP
jgi:hypothetical protein